MRSAGTGGRAVLSAGLAQPLPRIAVQLGREWTLADARRIRLRDADDVIDLRRTDARALTRARSDRRAARHVRIRSMIEIEKAPLRALEQHVLVLGDHVRNEAARIAGVLAQLLARGERVVDPLIDFALRRHGTAEMLDHGREVVEVRSDEVTQPLGSQQVTHAHPTARCLHFVRGTDATTRGPDRLAALRTVIFAQAVDELVVRQDHVRAEADEELASHEQAASLALRDLFEQRVRIDDHAVAEHAGFAGMADARRHEVRDQLLALDHERVAGIRAAAVAHDGMRPLGKEVDDLALTFIAPLGADDDDDRHLRRL
jgi:hypothetical protein